MYIRSQRRIQGGLPPPASVYCEFVIEQFVCHEVRNANNSRPEIQILKPFLLFVRLQQGHLCGKNDHETPWTSRSNSRLSAWKSAKSVQNRTRRTICGNFFKISSYWQLKLSVANRTAPPSAESCTVYGDILRVSAYRRQTISCWQRLPYAHPWNVRNHSQHCSLQEPFWTPGSNTVLDQKNKAKVLYTMV
jgi:hypothetical protein